MKITFVNHASLIFEHQSISLITDPWIEGNVFDNGWSLLSNSKFKYQDFNKVTHIWFSHEHPDHFSPPNLKKIPQEIRKKITILFQKTRDKKVVEFCNQLNFKETIELTAEKEYLLGPNFKLINSPFGHDSWLYIQTEQYSFLNTNDCVIKTAKQAKKIKAIVGKIDILLTQFSYAGKHGNTKQRDKRVQAIKHQKKQLKVQFSEFKPSIFIPIASFIWFSHQENFYMNDEIFTVDEVASFSLKNKIKPVVLYPGDIYQAGENHDNVKSINKYIYDFRQIKFKNTTKTISIPFNEIKKAFKKLQFQIIKKDFLYFIYISFFPIKFYLTDLDKTLKLSFLTGLRVVKQKEEDSNIKLTTEVLAYCLKFYWGFNTISVNARYQTVTDSDEKLLNKYETLTTSLNHSVRFHDKIASTIRRSINKISFKRIIYLFK